MEYSSFLSSSYARKKPNFSQEFRSDYKKFIEGRYKSALNRIDQNHLIFNSDVSAYLDKLLSTLKVNNPSYEFEKIRLILSRYTWPNAFSTGDGSIVINLGLAQRLRDESQLMFIISHEVAHYLLDHSDSLFYHNIRLNTQFKKKLNELRKEGYFVATKIREIVKNNLYSERTHNRLFEYAADSLGLEFFLNAGYKVDEAINALQLLDELNEPREYDVSIFRTFAIDSFELKNVALSIEDKHRDHLLIDDSIKTHPDIKQRINRIKVLDINPTKATSSASQFQEFVCRSISEMNNAHFTFNEIDLVLIKALEKRQKGDHSQKNADEILLSIYRLILAKNEHKITEITSAKTAGKSTAEIELTSCLFGLRYSIFLKKLYAYCQTLNTSENIDVVYAQMMLAYYSRDARRFNRFKNILYKNYELTKTLKKKLKYLTL